MASALLPVISAEIFVLGVLIHGSAAPWWTLALVIAVGQIGGKTVHYFAAQGLVRLPALMRGKSESHGGRFRAGIERFRRSCHDRPVWTGGVLLVSATASVPPFAAISVVAGWARVPLALFLVTGFLGRLARFGALTAAPTAMFTLAG